MAWRIKRSLARIVVMNSFSMKVSRLFTKKKGSKTNPKDALTVELQKSSKWETGAVAAVIEAATEILVAAVTGGK